MPKTIPLTAENKIKYQKIVARNACKFLMTKHKIKMIDVANVLNVSPQAISNQFRLDSITLDTALAVIYLCNASAEDIEKIMKVR